MAPKCQPSGFVLRYEHLCFFFVSHGDAEGVPACFASVCWMGMMTPTDNTPVIDKIVVCLWGEAAWVGLRSRGTLLLEGS